MAHETVVRPPALKLIAGADGFGAPLKDALVEYAKGKGIVVEDVGTDKYYTVAEKVAQKVRAEFSSDPTTDATSNGTTDATTDATTVAAPTTRGLLVCGTGMGVSIFANKYPGVYAAVCENVDTAKNARSINNSNVLALGGNLTEVETGKKILDAWLETEFKAPCPASDEKPWSADIEGFLDKSVAEMAQIGPRAAADAKTGNGAGNEGESKANCPICKLAKDRKFEDVEIMPGGSWQILRENPTSAIVRFKAGSVEPAHHHTFGHDIIVTAGSKRVYNLTAGEAHDLGPGDFLYTPAGQLHRVVYFTDTEFFIKWDGASDILLDEDLATAKAALQQEGVSLSS